MLNHWPPTMAPNASALLDVRPRSGSQSRRTRNIVLSRPKISASKRLGSQSRRDPSVERHAKDHASGGLDGVSSSRAEAQRSDAIEGHVIRDYPPLVCRSTTRLSLCCSNVSTHNCLLLILSYKHAVGSPSADKCE